MRYSQGLESGNDHMLPLENLEHYLDSLPSQYDTWNEAVPLGFPIWICEVVPSIVTAVKDVKSEEPKLYKNDNDVMNVVHIDEQFNVEGNDRDGFMSVLVFCPVSRCHWLRMLT